jgi:hypothetical protein
MSFIDKFKAFVADAEIKEAELMKRNGVYVSRPVLNAGEWAAWAKKWVPNPLPASELHVTVIYSTVDVKMVPCDDPLVVCVDEAVFAMFGPDEDAFVVAFRDYRLQCRHWCYLDNGAVSQWPTYRPHMTLSSDAKGFEIPDEALRECPEHIVLGAEIAGPIKGDAPADDTDPEGVEAEEEDQAIIVVIEIAQSEAKKSLERDDLSVVDRIALQDMADGHPVSAGVAKRLLKVAPTVVKALAGDAPAERQWREKSLRVTTEGAEAIKRAKTAEVLKTDEESRLIYAFSNVYSIGGVTVEDADGDGFTTEAMEEFTAELLKKDTSGTFEHEGELCNTVVQGLVMSHELQKAMGIDLGFEALITATHFPDPENWAKAKDGSWEQSIKGRFWYEGD